MTMPYDKWNNVPHCTQTEITGRGPSETSLKNWNDLPEAVRGQTSINGFKNSYDKWWNTQSLSDEKTSSVTRSMGNDE